MIRNFFTIIFLFIVCVFPSFAQTSQTGNYFPYPTVPDKLTSLTERCNYLVYHFWDYCNFKNAFSSLPKMNGALSDYLSFVPYCTADTAFISIDNLINKVKKNPKNTLALAKMARGLLMSDTCDFVSEELYLPFAKSVATHKKIDENERKPFEREVAILSNTMIGTQVADMELITADNKVIKLSANTAPMMLLFFTSKSCSDCNMSRLRLSADYALNQMIAQGRLKIINIYVGEDSEYWQKWSADAPATWVTVRNENAGELYDIEVQPTIIYLNRKMEVLGKNFTVDDIIRSFQGHIMNK